MSETKTKAMSVKDQINALKKELANVENELNFIEMHNYHLTASRNRMREEGIEVSNEEISIDSARYYELMARETQLNLDIKELESQMGSGEGIGQQQK